MSIVIERLTKRYHGQAVVNAVSLEVPGGELFVLLGPSGSGKSTLLRMIAGLVGGGESGRVTLHGRDVTALPPRERDIGFVFQHYALFSHMTVAENVEFGLRVRRISGAERRKRRDELLELVGLAGLGERLPHQLSGGQQQRVALARALAPRPSVLLLDEPFGALDAKIRVEMRHGLRQIQREMGITTIFVTHDQEEAFELGERLGIMHAGRLLEVGKPDEVYLRPETEFTASFLGTANILLGVATPTGIQVGPVSFALGTQAEPDLSPRRVQVLFRPEDVALAATAERLAGTPLGEAKVEGCSFAGTFERVRLRLPPLAGVRSIAPVAPFGANYFPLEATRPLEQAWQMPLNPGDVVWVGVRRLHALRHPGLSLLTVLTAAPAAQAALSLAADLAQLAHARLTVVGASLSDAEVREYVQTVKAQVNALPFFEAHATDDLPAGALARAVESQPCDLAVLSVEGGNASGLVDAALRAGEHHLLLVTRPLATLPTKMLVCVAANEPSKEDVLFAGRLARHLGAETTLLALIRAEAGTQEEAAHRLRVERFLDAGVRALARLGIAARPLVKAGPVHEGIAAEMTSGGHDLLVLGAPLRPLESAQIRPFLSGEVPYPVLVVRSPAVAPGPVRIGASKESIVEEQIP